MKYLAGLLLLLAPASVLATTVVALPEPELVRAADTIAGGTVLDVQTVIYPRGQVMTRANLQVSHALRGVSVNEVIAIEVPGGRVGSRLVAYTAGSPRFAKGDMVFGFFETKRGIRRPLGLSYGLLRMSVDGQGVYRVTRETDGLVMVSPQGQPVLPVTAVIRQEPVTELAARIRAQLSSPKVPVAPEGTVAP